MKHFSASESGNVNVALALIVAAFIVGVVTMYNGVALMFARVTLGL